MSVCPAFRIRSETAIVSEQKSTQNNPGIWAGGIFCYILGQDNNRADSKARLAEKLVSMVNCEPDEMLFIGDTIHDFEVAQEAGMRCCLVSNGHCSEERLKATGVPVYKNLTELYENYKW